MLDDAGKKKRSSRRGHEAGQGKVFVYEETLARSSDTVQTRRISEAELLRRRRELAECGWAASRSAPYRPLGVPVLDARTFELIRAKDEESSDSSDSESESETRPGSHSPAPAPDVDLARNGNGYVLLREKLRQGEQRLRDVRAGGSHLVRPTPRSQGGAPPLVTSRGDIGWGNGDDARSVNGAARRGRATSSASLRPGIPGAFAATLGAAGSGSIGSPPSMTSLHSVVTRAADVVDEERSIGPSASVLWRRRSESANGHVSMQPQQRLQQQQHQQQQQRQQHHQNHGHAHQHQHHGSGSLPHASSMVMSPRAISASPSHRSLLSGHSHAHATLHPSGHRPRQHAQGCPEVPARAASPQTVATRVAGLTGNARSVTSTSDLWTGMDPVIVEMRKARQAKATVPPLKLPPTVVDSVTATPPATAGQGKPPSRPQSQRSARLQRAAEQSYRRKQRQAQSGSVVPGDVTVRRHQGVLVDLLRMTRATELDPAYQLEVSRNEFYQTRTDLNNKLRDNLVRMDSDRPDSYRRKFSALNINNWNTQMEIQSMRLAAERARIQQLLELHESHAWYITMLTMITEAGRDVSLAERFIVNNIKSVLEAGYDLTRAYFFSIIQNLKHSEMKMPEVQKLLNFLREDVLSISNLDYRDFLVLHGISVPAALQQQIAAAKKRRNTDRRVSAINVAVTAFSASAAQPSAGSPAVQLLGKMNRSSSRSSISSLSRTLAEHRLDREQSRTSLGAQSLIVPVTATSHTGGS